MSTQFLGTANFAPKSSGFKIQKTGGFAISSSSSCLQLPRRNVSLGVGVRVQKHIVRGSQLSALTTCKAMGENSGTSASSESILLDEQSLERELQVAIMLENYAEAARIRDNLRILHEDRKASVLAANSRFYDAFSKGDLASMQALWAKGEDVCCVHPGASGISGYDLVMTSWEYVWVNYEFPLQIELKDIKVHVRGDVGYVTCVELVRTKGSGWGRQFATNVFERVDRQWYICIHHASPVDL
ncbi:F-box protein SKIP8-like protein [Drosera capensis]